MRTWITTLGKTNSDQMAADTGKALLTVGKTGTRLNDRPCPQSTGTARKASLFHTSLN
ncbi:MAG: hypothetical protein HC894_12410 [Microcoleus sp. SM1_3_4]|nr:hypothetical protein [Microcoleus sp. SM1_3_4]